ncbi:MAG: hypothetical protein ACI9KM_002800 [Rubritalea sp.]
MPDQSSIYWSIEIETEDRHSSIVDPNPIRANLCNTPKGSDHTSIKARIAPSLDLKKTADDEIIQQRLQRFDSPLKPLAQFEGNVTSREQISVLFSLKDYLQLVDTTGRMIRTDKPSSLKNFTPHNSLKSDVP